MTQNQEQKSQWNIVRVELTGNIVRDPQILNTKRGEVIKITLACNEVYNGTDGQTWWVDCIFMRDCATLAQTYRKGDLISVGGLLQPSRIKGTWIDPKTNEERLNNDVCIVTPTFKKEGETGTILPMQLQYRKPVQQQQYNQPYLDQVTPQPVAPPTYMEAANQQVTENVEQQELDFHLNEQQHEQKLHNIMTGNTPPIQPQSQPQDHSYAISKGLPQQLPAQPKATIETVVANESTQMKSNIRGFMS